MRIHLKSKAELDQICGTQVVAAEIPLIHVRGGQAACRPLDLI